MKETKVVHAYRLYGRWFEGYGPSMDPHRCGDPEQPCITSTWEREVSEWKVVDADTKGLDGYPRS